MNNEYITIRKEASDSFTEKKSRFIGYACPCDSEDNAIAFIQQIKQKHKDASHNCYAYVIGTNSGIMRYSDDGEPGGTAGLPIMNVVKSLNIVNCCVVVTRYFGGVLLGTGGLVRAYTQGCQLAIQASGIVRMEMTRRDRCEIPYSHWNQVQYTASKLPVIISEIEYGAFISFTLSSRSNDHEFVIDELTKCSSGEVVIRHESEGFQAWDI